MFMGERYAGERESESQTKSFNLSSSYSTLLEKISMFDVSKKNLPDMAFVPKNGGPAGELSAM